MRILAFVVVLYLMVDPAIAIAGNILPRRAEAGGTFTLLFETDFEETDDNLCDAAFSPGTISSINRTGCDITVSPAPLGGLESYRQADVSATTVEFQVHSLFTPKTSGILVVDFTFTADSPATGGGASRIFNWFKANTAAYESFSGLMWNSSFDTFLVFDHDNFSGVAWSSGQLCEQPVICRGRVVWDFGDEISESSEIQFFADIDTGQSCEALTLRTGRVSTGFGTSDPMSGFRMKMQHGDADPERERFWIDDLSMCSADDPGGVPATGCCGSF